MGQGMKYKFRKFVLAIVVLSLGACVTFKERAYAFAKGQDRPYDMVELSDDLFYVGTSDIAVYALKTDAGVILFDTGYKHTHDLVVENIKAADIKLSDIKLILNTQAHMDHASGMEKMRSETSAEVRALEIARGELMRGGRDDFSILTSLMPFDRVTKVTKLAEAETSLGSTQIAAYNTPGHTKGCTSWSFNTKIQGVDRHVTLLCGFVVLPFTKLDNNSKYPNIRSDYLDSIKVLEAFKDNCDIILTPHRKHGDTKRTIEDLDNEIYKVDRKRCQRILDDEINYIEIKLGL